MKKPKASKQKINKNHRVTNCLQPVKVMYFCQQDSLGGQCQTDCFYTRLLKVSAYNQTVTPCRKTVTLCKGETTLTGGYCSHYQLTLLKTRDKMATQTVGTSSKGCKPRIWGLSNMKHFSVVIVSTLCISTATFVTFLQNLLVDSFFF